MVCRFNLFWEFIVIYCNVTRVAEDLYITSSEESLGYSDDTYDVLCMGCDCGIEL